MWKKEDGEFLCLIDQAAKIEALKNQKEQMVQIFIKKFISNSQWILSLIRWLLFKVELLSYFEDLVLVRGSQQYELEIVFQFHKHFF